MKNTDTQVNYEIENEMAFITCLGAVLREVRKKKEIWLHSQQNQPKEEKGIHH